MKKWAWILAAALLLILGLSSCHLYTPPARQPVAYFDFLGDEETLRFADEFYTNTPVSVTVRYDSIISGAPTTSTDAATITAVFEVMLDITVYDTADHARTDDFLSYYFEFADGSRTRDFVFQGNAVLVDDATVHMADGVDELKLIFPPSV